MRYALTAALWLVVAACSDDPAGASVDVVVSAPPPGIDPMLERIRVSSEWLADGRTRSFESAATFEGDGLVATVFRVRPEQAAHAGAELYRIRGEGLVGGVSIVAAQARLVFVPGRRLVLPLRLTQACVHVSCDDGLSCEDGRCVTDMACVGEECMCGAGQTSCAGRCVDTMTDPAHCGACGNACAIGATCVDGASLCLTPATSCADGCRDLDSDPGNCGACANQCAPGQVCRAGACGCAAGHTPCGGVCTDLATDRDHCGECSSRCPGSANCRDGVCFSG